MKNSKLAICLICVTSLGCQYLDMNNRKVDIQGHRGTRGLMPENTIPAFVKALDLGITTLELDLAVTKDMELLISHEPYMGAHLALDSLGNDITREDELNHNIFEMSYDQIKRYDVGSKFIDRFPEQQKLKTCKPLFKELVDTVKSYTTQRGITTPIWYNIEIKSLPEGDDLFHPTPAVYSKLVYDFIEQNMDKQNLNVQSFDYRVLQYFHDNYPEITLAVLIENELSIDQNLDSLDFVPQIYSCYFKLLDEKKVKYLQSKKMKVIPWTVNSSEDIKSVLGWGVDGIISDYPDRVLEAVQ